MSSGILGSGRAPKVNALYATIPQKSRMPSCLLFVYGSLKRGGEHHALLEAARYLGAARTAPGYALVRYVEGYPALHPVPDTDASTSTVTGELYEVELGLLGELDAFEECPSLYQRARLEVCLQSAGGSFGGTRLIAEAYVIAPAVARSHSLLNQ